MFQRNFMAATIFHIFLVHPIEYTLLWYCIVGFPGSINAEDCHLFSKSDAICIHIMRVVIMLRMCNRINNDIFNITDTLGVASVPAFRLLLLC
jgi:hypothetical protein